VELIGYRHGYHGVLTGASIVIDDAARAQAHVLHRYGGSPLGNSRVKLTNAADLARRGVIQEGQDPLEVAAERLRADGIDVLHTIGGDDTNTTAADLAAFLHERGYELTVVGLPKTIDNDIIPIRQSLGALTAAEQASRFAQNIIAEHGSNPRMLIIHEVMGRGCGWLTAAAAREYQAWHDAQEWVPSIGLTAERWAIHGVYVPETHIDLDAEAVRLKAVMDENDCVNLFLSEGAGVSDIVAQLEASGQKVQRDPFGHVKLDTINPGAWFARAFGAMIGAEKTMVQKSGYFSRSAPANETDLALVKSMVDKAVEAAQAGTSGVIGHDEERGDELRAIEFPRIAGHKAFDTDVEWFQQVLARTGQA
jgi:pyrophosphate--fructose-6-phosphate 1-phosphotransferase